MAGKAKKNPAEEATRRAEINAITRIENPDLTKQTDRDKAFGALCGISYRGVQDIRLGRRNLGANAFRKLKENLGGKFQFVTLEAILGQTVQKERKSS